MYATMFGVVDLIHRGEVAGVERVVALLHEREQVRGPAGGVCVVGMMAPFPR